MGCATVLALIAAVVVACALHYAPPLLRNVASAYGRRVSERLGINKESEGAKATADTSSLGYAGKQLSEERQAVYLHGKKQPGYIND